MDLKHSYKIPSQKHEVASQNLVSVINNRV